MILPSQDQQGIIYLGQVGLKGGGGNVSTCSGSGLWDLPEAIARTAENQ